MTRAIATLATLAALTAVAARPCHAQGRFGASSSRPISIGLAGGMTVPTSDTRDAFKSGAHVEGFIKLHLPGGFPAFRAALNYEKLDIKQLVGVPGAATTTTATAQTAILGALGQLQFDLIRGPISPYVVAGVGAFNLKAEGTDATASKSKMEFGIDGGAGLAIRLGPISAFAEARMRNVYTNTGWIDTKSIKAVPVSFGLMF